MAIDTGGPVLNHPEIVYGSVGADLVDDQLGCFLGQHASVQCLSRVSERPVYGTFLDEDILQERPVLGKKQIVFGSQFHPLLGKDHGETVGR